MPISFIINLSLFGLIWWLAIYLVSRNARSKIAWISAGFLASLIIYGLGERISRHLTDYSYYDLLWTWAEWSYILPIALLFHFSVICTKAERDSINKYFLFFVYF